MKFYASVAVSLWLLAGCSGPVANQKAEHHEAHWDYGKHGPEHWGDFSGTCKEGRAQSPINVISTKAIPIPPTNSIRMDEDIHTKASVVDNGHSIKVVPEKGGYIQLGDKRYKLIQFHFHGYSEHTIDGKRYDLVAHMVHQADDGSLAVVAVFYAEGKNNPLLDNILGNVGETILVDPQDLLPKDATHYYHYVGSLTTPPCTENVNWYLIKMPNSISKEQIKAFRKYYKDNERPVQPVNNRIIETL